MAIVRESVARTKWLWDMGQANGTASAFVSQYFRGLLRGKYFVLDHLLAAISEPSTAATANPLEILPPELEYRLSKEFIPKPKCEQPSHHALLRTRVHLGVLPDHYPALLERMHHANMI